MKRHAPAVLALFAALAVAPSALSVSETFETYCAGCHGDDGKAQTEEGRKKKARNLTDKKWQEAVDDARIETTIRKGRDKMPSFKGKLTDDEIKALVQEVRGFAGK